MIFSGKYRSACYTAVGKQLEIWYRQHSKWVDTFLNSYSTTTIIYLLITNTNLILGMYPADSGDYCTLKIVTLQVSTLHTAYRLKVQEPNYKATKLCSNPTLTNIPARSAKIAT